MPSNDWYEFWFLLKGVPMVEDIKNSENDLTSGVEYISLSETAPLTI